MELETLSCPQCGNGRLRELEIAFGMGVVGYTRGITGIVFKCSKCGLDFVLTNETQSFGTRDVTTAPKEIIFTHRFIPAEFSEDKYIYFPNDLEVDIVVTNRQGAVISKNTGNVIPNDGKWQFVDKVIFESFKNLGAPMRGAKEAHNAEHTKTITGNNTRTEFEGSTNASTGIQHGSNN